MSIFDVGKLPKALRDLVAREQAKEEAEAAEAARRPAVAQELAEWRRGRPARVAPLVSERDAAGVAVELADAALRVALARKGAADAALFEEGARYTDTEQRLMRQLAEGKDPRIEAFGREVYELTRATRAWTVSSADVRREIVTQPNGARTAYERTYSSHPSHERRLRALYAADARAKQLGELATSDDVTAAIAEMRASIPELREEIVKEVVIELGHDKMAAWEQPSAAALTTMSIGAPGTTDEALVIPAAPSAPIGWMAPGVP